MSVVVIDYGMSNLGSIRRSLEECGTNVKISDDPNDLKTAERIILPGVGAFRDGMVNLRSKRWIESIKEEVLGNNIPILGICLGMQLLADKGYEGGEIDGLGLIPGEVRKLVTINPDERIPHMGWNEIYKTKTNPLFDNIPNGSDFYFVHSFHFNTRNQSHIAATTPYCGEFTSVISYKNIFGVQFHPEKSQYYGLKLLSNFLNLF